MAKKYTVYNTDTNTAEATGRPWPTADGVSDPVGMPSNLLLLEEVTSDRPTYDNKTHKLVENAIAYDTTAKTATRSWSAVALTQAEIDERTPAHVEINGIKWKTDEVSQAAFSSMTLLIDKAGMAETDMVAIKDALGASHNMTVAQYNADAVTYGLHCYTQFHS